MNVIFDRSRVVENYLPPFRPNCPYCGHRMGYQRQRVIWVVDLECPSCGTTMAVFKYIYQAWAEVGH